MRQLTVRNVPPGLIDFNPRTHEECDYRLKPRLIPHSYFNPRTHEECDSFDCRSNLSYLRFQSTHSRGVRQDFTKAVSMADSFQSTHSRGVRQFSIVVTSSSDLFQSTHSRGVRLDKNAIVEVVDPFQSTHSRGVRLEYRLKQYHRFGDFNPRTHEECDFRRRQR